MYDFIVIQSASIEFKCTCAEGNDVGSVCLTRLGFGGVRESALQYDTAFDVKGEKLMFQKIRCDSFWISRFIQFKLDLKSYSKTRHGNDPTNELSVESDGEFLSGLVGP